MKKIYNMTDLECASCASKIEDNIKKIDGVESVSVNFFTQKLTLEADENKIDEILKKAIKICRKIEPDCRIIV